MNYYERHLGDYARDTAHLTLIEHGAYSVLLDRYYTTEEGIPADQAHRVARARSKEEKQAVDTVLSEFFDLVDGVWIKGRVQEEIIKAQTKIKAAKENGKRGGRPRNNPDETKEKPTGLFLGSENKTQEKAHQTPDTILKPTSQPDASARDPQKFAMHIGWQPSDEFATLAKMAMVTMPDGKLGEFIAHWLTQPITQRTQAEWDKALLQSCQHDKLRKASPIPPKGKPQLENFANKDYGTGVNPL